MAIIINIETQHEVRQNECQLKPRTVDSGWDGMGCKGGGVHFIVSHLSFILLLDRIIPVLL